MKHTQRLALALLLATVTGCGTPSSSGAYSPSADATRAVNGDRHLRAANLAGADLHGLNLSGADLRGATLDSADLSWANLSGADLTGADATWAQLDHADLRGADLTGVALYHTSMEGVRCDASTRWPDAFIAPRCQP